MDTSSIIFIPLKKGDIKRFNLKASDVIAMAGKLWLKVPAATPEIAKECNRGIWRTEKQEQRQARCLVENEKGYLVRCCKNCHECDRDFRSPYASLNELAWKNPGLFAYEDEGFDRVDTECTYTSVMKRLEELNPAYADSLTKFCYDFSITDIAKAEGLAKSTIHERISRAINLARLIYNGEI